MTDDADLVQLAVTVGSLEQRVAQIETLATRVTALEARGAISPDTAAELEARHTAEMAARQDHEALIKQLRNSQIASLVGIPTALVVGGLANALLMPHITSFLEHIH